MNVHTEETPAATPGELTQLVVSGGRVLARRIHRIESTDGAADIAPVLRDIITAAQELLGVAEHVYGDDDQEPAEFTGAWAETTAGRAHAFNPDGGNR